MSMWSSGALTGQGPLVGCSACKSPSVCSPYKLPNSHAGKQASFLEPFIFRNWTRVSVKCVTCNQGLLFSCLVGAVVDKSLVLWTWKASGL